MFLASSRSLLESPEVLASLALLLTAYLLRFGFTKRGKEVDDSPILGQPGDPDFQAALTSGYKKASSAKKKCHLFSNRGGLTKSCSLKTLRLQFRPLIIPWSSYLQSFSTRSKLFRRTL